MTEHSVEELKRQLEAAHSKVAEAQRAYREAQRRLRLAKLEATGLNGHVVSFTKTWGARSGAEIKFVVRSIPDWPSGCVSGPMIKKDGTEGEREERGEIKKLIDHGPYVEPQS